MVGAFALLVLSGCVMSKKYLPRKERVLGMLRACIRAMDPSGNFTRQEAFRDMDLNGLLSRHSYGLFKELIAEGAVIVCHYKVYSLSPEIMRSVGMSSEAFTEKEVEYSVKTLTVAKDTIDYLNHKLSRKFKATPKVQSMVNARIKEGAKSEDFKTVIDKKCKDWLGTKFAAYLRPETLFGTKFMSYLNELERQQKTEKMESYNFNRFFGGDK